VAQAIHDAAQQLTRGLFPRAAGGR